MPPAAFALALTAIALWSTLAALSLRLQPLQPFLLAGIGLGFGGLLSVRHWREWKLPMRERLIGLVGTIYGIIPLFIDFGKALSGDYALLAKGIGTALNKTLAGLMVAIPTLVFWSYYNKKVEVLAVELEGECDEDANQTSHCFSRLMNAVRMR